MIYGKDFVAGNGCLVVMLGRKLIESMGCFYRNIALVFSAFVFLTSCSAPENNESEVSVVPRENRPNIVFILADDLDLKLGTIGYMQNLQDLLVERGTVLEDFFITTPMCCPSRANFLRGQYTHSHLLYNNDPPFGGFHKFHETGAEHSTIAVWLQSAGYRTALVGKYLNGYPYREDRAYVPPGWSEWYSPAQKNAYDGYDYVLNENGILKSYPPNERYYFTDVMNGKAVDFIERAAQDETPFFLYLPTFAPHAPATAARRHLDLLPFIQAPRTPSFNAEDVSGKPGSTRHTPLLTEEEIARIDRIYRQRVLSMLAVDEMIADLIAALERTGQLENTYVVFSSDQGYHLGQHRLFEGKSTLYDEDIAVPFIVRGPGVPEGERVSGFLTGSVDVAPTFADWAGVNPPGFVEGRSLVEIISTNSTPATDWRTGFLLEFYPFIINERSVNIPRVGRYLNWVFDLPFIPPQEVVPQYRGIRTLEYTYIEHDDGFVELYDIRADPYQLENLAFTADPAFLDWFSAWLHEYASCKGVGCSRVDEGISDTIR
jgi:N-acetylglucosamine-6-sulfatase